MDERWQEIERVYHAVRGLEKSTRPAFLAKVCAGDEVLRREVESLLVQADSDGSFLESPAIEAEARALVADGSLSDQSTIALEPGALISHYRLGCKLGAGGMGEVYRARDTKLGRDVALKILPEAMAHDAQRMARFEREARTLASLNHPNIAAIHDLEESNSIHALVMELVEGPTLAERIAGAGLVPTPGRPQEPVLSPAKGPPVQEFLCIARQIAEALEYAHERGVIHRDLKPANVKITPEGMVKVLDFGLAKAVAAGVGLAPSDAALRPGGTHSPTLSATVTEAGTIMGTPAYMSPEQARGQPVDRRTDIWAFGCVLFEMLAGRRAFEGETISEVLAAVLMREPDWNALPASTPVAIQKLVHHCLVKDPKRRLRDIGDARIAIEETLAGGTTADLAGGIPAGTPPLPGGAEVRGRPEVSALAGRRYDLRWLAAVAIVVMAVFGTLVVLNVGGLREWLAAATRAGYRAPFPKIESVAVLPLENLSGDPQQEYFADGMTEELITDLGKISALRVISRQSVMRYKGSKKPLPEIARELHVDAIVEGAVRREGGQVRITAQLIQASTDQHLWAESYQRDLRSVLALQGEIASAIADKVRAVVTPAERARLASARLVNPEAYEAYLKGMEHWYKLTPEDLDTALQYFELALKKDPNYAPAYAGIAMVWVGRQQMGYTAPREAGPKAKAAVLKAVELDNTLAQAHLSLASVNFGYEWDWAGAEVEFKRAIELNPNYPDARAFYSNYLIAMKRPEEAMAQIQRALELDPLNAFFQAFYGIDLRIVGRDDEAIVQFRKALKTSPGLPFAHGSLSDILRRKAKYEESLAEQKASWPGHLEVEEALTQGYARSGYRGAMRRAADILAARYRKAYVNPTDVAVLYAWAGEKAQALAWLEKGLEVRDPSMPYIGIETTYDTLRSDARFQEILRRMNFPKEAG